MATVEAFIQACKDNKLDCDRWLPGEDAEKAVPFHLLGVRVGRSYLTLGIVYGVTPEVLKRFNGENVAVLLESLPERIRTPKPLNGNSASNLR